MKNRPNFLLISSLALNCILLVLLVLAYTSRPAGDRVTATPAADQATGVPSPTAARPTIIVVTATTLPTAVAPPTATPLPTPTPQPSPDPSPSPAAVATATQVPSPTNLPSETPTRSISTLAPGPDWLRYTNQFRLGAGLPQLVEDPTLTEGCRLHSIYMVKTDQLWHDEDPNSTWYREAGRTAAQNGNISASDWPGEPEPTWAINFWMSAPFHALPMLDPKLRKVGYSSYRETIGDVLVAATMDIKSGQGELPADLDFPIAFPPFDGETWILQHKLPEFPKPLASCPGYQRPVGAPLMLQLGSGDRVPSVTEHTLLRDGQLIEHCLFDETSYVDSTNPDSQRIGRHLLDTHDAVVIIPREPLQTGSHYIVNLVIDGQVIEWHFDAVAVPG